MCLDFLVVFKLVLAKTSLHHLEFIRPGFYLTKLASDSWGNLPTFFHVWGCICVERMVGKCFEAFLVLKKWDAEGEFSGVYRVL